MIVDSNREWYLAAGGVKLDRWSGMFKVTQSCAFALSLNSEHARLFEALWGSAAVDCASLRFVCQDAIGLL